MKLSFLHERMGTKTHFEKKAKGNSVGATQALPRAPK